MRRLGFLFAAVALTLLFAGVAQAGTLSFTGGVVTYQAAGGETNHVIVASQDGGVVVIDVGAPVFAGAGCTFETPHAASCASVGSSHVEIFADDMGDYVNTAALELESRIEGGDGDDVLSTGVVYNSRTVMDGGPGADIFETEGGTVDYSGRTNPITVTVGDDQANDGEAGEGDTIPSGVGWVIGGQGNDHMSGRDDIPELNVKGGPGDDLLEAKTYAHLAGGEGDDRIVGESDAQYMNGGEGNDLLRSGEGADFLNGGSGKDELVGGLHVDSLRGGEGKDTIRSRDGWKDKVDGGAGFDRAHVDVGQDVLRRIEKRF
jgi:Ca2+-binding RTX toxin-like protein